MMDIVLGAHFGDEGKGKVRVLSSKLNDEREMTRLTIASSRGADGPPARNQLV